MTPVERELLDAIHKVDKNMSSKLIELETKIDDSISGRFKDNERRITKLEENQRWVIMAIVGSVITAVMAFILK